MTGTYDISQGEATKIVSGADPLGEYELISRGGTVKVDTSRSRAQQYGRVCPPNQFSRVEKHQEMEEVWAYAPDSAATVHISKTRFSLIREAQDVINGIRSTVDQDDDSAPPASDDFVHRFDTGNDVNAAAAEESFKVPNRADTVTVSVDDAAGAFYVELEFLDSDGGSVVTERGGSGASDYSGDGSTDVFVTAAAASRWCRVRIVDDSGAANALDYSVYAR